MFGRKYRNASVFKGKCTKKRTINVYQQYLVDPTTSEWERMLEAKLFNNIQKASEIGFLRRFLGLFCVTVKFPANSRPGPR